MQTYVCLPQSFFTPKFSRSVMLWKMDPDPVEGSRKDIEKARRKRHLVPEPPKVARWAQGTHVHSGVRWVASPRWPWGYGIIHSGSQTKTKKPKGVVFLCSQPRAEPDRRLGQGCDPHWKRQLLWPVCHTHTLTPIFVSLQGCRHSQPFFSQASGPACCRPHPDKVLREQRKRCKASVDLVISTRTLG
jgi:hypothetical protein